MLYIPQNNCDEIIMNSSLLLPFDMCPICNIYISLFSCFIEHINLIENSLQKALLVVSG